MSDYNDTVMKKTTLMLNGFFKSEQIAPFVEMFENKFRQEEHEYSQCNDSMFEKISQRQFIDKLITTAKNDLDTETYYKFLLELAGILAESEQIHLAEEILMKSLGEVKAERYYAESLLATADIYIRKAYWNNSISLIKQSKEIFARINDVSGLAKCENLLGILYGERGDLIKSRAHFLVCRNLLDHNIDKKFSAQIESNLAVIENIVGNFTKAEKYFKDALNKFTLLRDYKNIAEIRHNLGMFYFEQQEFSKAVVEFDKSIEIALKGNYKTILSISYLGKANTLLAQEDYDIALEFAYMAMDTAIRIEDKLTIADVYRIMGIVEKKLNRYDTAEGYFQTSIRLNNELDNKLNSAETSLELGLLFLETGQESEKNHWLQKSLQYYSGVGAVDKVKMIGKFLSQKVN
jgi:tetratricopeptide (TPR) repeat protein